MTNHINSETIQQFLQGDLNPAVLGMLEHVKTCPECRQEFDLALLSEEWLLSGNPERSNPASHLSDKEWNTAFDSGWNKASAGSKETKTIIPFYRTLYALAACLILLFGAYILFKPTRLSEQKAFTAVIPEIKPVTRNLPTRKMKINNNATILASSESDIRVTRSSKKSVATEMNQGSALFSIEPNQYKSFQVSTPDAEITVTGTIFDVLISGNTTRVSVIRGSVSVFYKNLKAKVSLVKDETVSPDSGRAIVKPLSAKEKSELNAYLDKITATALEENQTPLARIRETVPIVPYSQVLEQKLNLGLKSLNEKDYPAALNYFNEIKSAGLKNSVMQTACFESALLLLNKMGRTDDGLKALDEYLQLFDKGLYKEEALVDLITAHRKQGNTDKIIQYEKEYVKAFPEKDNSSDFSYEIATLQRETKNDFPEAALSYSTFINNYPKDFRVEDALFWLGKCHLLANQTAKAREVYAGYLKKYPEGRWVNDIHSLLKQ